MVVAVVPTKFGNQTHALTCLNGSPVNLDQIVSIIPYTIKLALSIACFSKWIVTFTFGSLSMQRDCNGPSVRNPEKMKAIIYLDEVCKSESNMIA